MEEVKAPTITISVSRKVNLGDYESSDVFFAVSGLPIGASAEEIQAAIQTGEVAFQYLAGEVRAAADRLRTGMK